MKTDIQTHAHAHTMCKIRQPPRGAHWGGNANADGKRHSSEKCSFSHSAALAWVIMLLWELKFNKFKT